MFEQGVLPYYGDGKTHQRPRKPDFLGLSESGWEEAIKQALPIARTVVRAMVSRRALSQVDPHQVAFDAVCLVLKRTGGQFQPRMLWKASRFAVLHILKREKSDGTKPYKAPPFSEFSDFEVDALRSGEAVGAAWRDAEVRDLYNYTLRRLPKHLSETLRASMDGEGLEAVARRNGWTIRTAKRHLATALKLARRIAADPP